MRSIGEIKELIFGKEKPKSSFLDDLKRTTAEREGTKIPEIYDIEQVREILGMSQHQVRTLVQQGILKAYRPGVRANSYDQVTDPAAIASIPLTFEASEIIEKHRKWSTFGKKPIIIAPENLVEHEQPVKEAAKFAAKQDGVTAEQARGEIARLGKMRESLLPIESDAKAQIGARLAELDCLSLNALFPSIDLSFLRWRRKDDGWPVFAFFSIEKKDCSLSVDRGGWSSNPKIPYGDTKHIATAFYGDVFDRLETFRTDATGLDRSVLSATFKGVIPEKTREKIVDCAKGKLFGNIIIVAEAPWHLRKEIIDPDPLVIGVKHGKAWLIDVFDLTPTEQIIKSEWTTGPDKK